MKALVLAVLVTVQAAAYDFYPCHELVLARSEYNADTVKELKENKIMHWFDKEGKLHIILPDPIFTEDDYD